jgi:hypothetical protein
VSRITLAVKEGAMNREQNSPGGRDGEGRNQQRQPDEHGGNLIGVQISKVVVIEEIGNMATMEETRVLMLT